MEKAHILKIGNGNGLITTDMGEIERLLKADFTQLYANKKF